MNPTKQLKVTGHSGGIYQIGDTIIQKLNGINKTAQVVGVATEEDFLAAQPDALRSMYNEHPFLLFENYYWIETTKCSSPPLAPS